MEEEDEVEASGEVGAVVEVSTEEAGEEEAEALVEGEVEALEAVEEAGVVRHCFSHHFFIFSRTRNFI